jgi:LDH2 family malate/lactate/ureidoglycolate dehydrogenase
MDVGLQYLKTANSHLNLHANENGIGIVHFLDSRRIGILWRFAAPVLNAQPE